eukprot:Em0036g17a
MVLFYIPTSMHMVEIQEYFQTVIAFLRLEKVEFGSIKGQTLSDMVQRIFQEFQELMTGFAGRTDDTTDISNAKFIADHQAFMRKVADMDQRLAYIMCQAFDDCPCCESVFKELRERVDSHMEKMRKVNHGPFLSSMLFRCSGPWKVLTSAMIIHNKYDEMMQLISNSSCLHLVFFLIFEGEVYSEWTQEVDDIAKANLNKPLLVRHPHTKKISVNFDPQERAATKETRYNQVTQDGQKITKLVAENLQYFQAEPDSAVWENYLDYLDDLQNMDKGAPSLLPLLEAKLELQAPKVVFQPSMKMDSPDGFLSLVDGIIEDIFNLVALVPRVASHLEATNYVKDMEEIVDLSDKKDEVSNCVYLVVDQASKYCSTFDGYTYLWVDDREEFLRQFLLYGHIPEEIEAAGEAGVPKTLPTLAGGQDTKIFDLWFRVDARPFKQGLLNTVKRWSLMFKQHLLNHVSHTLNDLVSYVKVTIAGLSVTVPEGEYKALVEVMGHLLAVKERQEETDTMFEPLKQTIELLKSYGQPLPEDTNQPMIQLPEQWNNVKKLSAAVMKQNVAPLQANECNALRRKLATFYVKQHEFREKFRVTAPFQFDAKMPYVRVDKTGGRAFSPLTARPKPSTGPTPSSIPLNPHPWMVPTELDLLVGLDSRHCAQGWEAGQQHAPQVVQAGLTLPMVIQAVHPAVQAPGRNSCAVNNGGCKYLCLLKEGGVGYGCACPTGVLLATDGHSCQDISTFILFTHRVGIRRLSLDTPELISVPLPVYNLSVAGGLAWDLPINSLFWADRSSMYMFWTDWGARPLIGRSALDGSGRIDLVTTNLNNRTVLLSNLLHPYGMALYGGYLYWTDWTSQTIQQVNKTTGRGQMSVVRGISYMNAIQVVVIQRQTFQPTSLAVDWIGRKLYWADLLNQHLEVANLDGSSVSASQGISVPRGLTLHLQDTYLYWTDDTNVNRVTMDGTTMFNLIKNQCEPTSLTITDSWIGDDIRNTMYALYASSPVTGATTSLNTIVNFYLFCYGDTAMQRSYLDFESLGVLCLVTSARSKGKTPKSSFVEGSGVARSVRNKKLIS